MDMSANIVTIINVPNTNKSLQLMDNSDNWIVTENNVLTTINKMFYSELEQLWMAVGEGPNDTIATSTDGITWMGKGMIFNIRGNSVHYKGGVWVAVGEDSNKTKNIVFSSNNGENWSCPSGPLTVTGTLQIITPEPLHARYIRFQRISNVTFIHLNEIEVYGFRWNST